MTYDTNIKTCKDYLHTYFNEYLHNRVGTYLYKSEKDVNNLNERNFNSSSEGSLIIYEIKHSEYIWVIYNGDSDTPGMKKIYYKDNNNNIKREDVRVTSLHTHPVGEPIIQDTTKGMRYDEAYIFETYNLDNLEK
jgi:hypothetical protein